MNRRKFALTIAASAGAAVLGPAGLHAAVLSPVDAAPGWSSAHAASLLKGSRFRVRGVEDSVLELVDVETYRVDDSQYFASFRACGEPMPEGLYRLQGPTGTVEFYLQPRDGAGLILEAAVCHARG
ncbi:MAG: hypothetical protein CMP07_10365 [Xanthomonadales bacterium]|nr:hypothetical protein [Xanthomonadales bacterium]|tara:strand:+ start:197 stop:574 length:378 start_codon:yes stop_codon:yes gene_type:complete